LAAHVAPDPAPRGAVARKPRDGPERVLRARLTLSRRRPRAPAESGGDPRARRAAPAAQADPASLRRGSRRLARRRRLETRALRRRQGALRESRARAARVVLARSDVVRPVRVEERCERLDVPAADAELELAAAVHADPVRVAMLDALEQARDRSEP